MKNVERSKTEAVRDEQTTSTSKDPLFMGIQYTKETSWYLSFKYISHIYFWVYLAIPNHARPTPVIFLLTYKRINFTTKLIIEKLEFQEGFTIWSVECFLGNNSKAKFLPDMKFGMGNHIKKTLLSDCFKENQIKKKNFLKKYNALFWGPKVSSVFSICKKLTLRRICLSKDMFI